MSLEIVKKIVDIMVDKKAQDIEVIKVEKITSLTDYMVLCTATSSTHIRTLAGEIEEKLKSEQFLHHKEGHESSSWVLIDYVDIIVNIFSKETREFYRLDKIWSDGEKLDLL